jgi:hypothetical protein
VNLTLLLLPILLWIQAPSPPRAAITGRVVNGVTGVPVRNARIQLFSISDASSNSLGGGEALDAWTDSTGAFEFPNLRPGQFGLDVRKDGFWYDRSQLPDGAPDSFITLHDGEQKSKLLLRLTPWGVLSGRIKDEDGEPVRGIWVAAMVYNYTAKGRVLTAGMGDVTNDRGEYRMFQVAPGRYYLRAGTHPSEVHNRDGGTSYIPTFYPGVGEAAGASWIDLAAGQQVADLNFVVRRARLATISGRLMAPKDAVKTFVRLVTLDAAGSVTSILDLPLKRDNSFTASGVQSGAIELAAGYQLGDQRFGATLPLQVGSKDIDGIELHGIPPLTLHGRVLVEGGDVSPSGVQVSLLGTWAARDENGPREPAAVHADGNFTIADVSPAIYQVYLNGLNGIYWKDTRWGPGGGGAELVEGHLDLTLGAPPNAELTIVIGADPGQVSGTVSDADSKPLSAFVVLASVGAAPRRAFLSRSSGSGHFIIDNVPPGDYKLFAWREQVDYGRVMYDPEYLKPVESEGQEVRVEGNGKQVVDAKLTEKRPN